MPADQLRPWGEALMRTVTTLLRNLLLVALLAGSGLWSPPTMAGGQVWVNTNTGVYHCPGGRYYGNTKHGKYLSENAAVANGFRPAYGAQCSSRVELASPPANRQSVIASPTGSGVKVWINTKSHVYHCPGSRHYGVTKSGRYATESEASAAGNRPAFGTPCS